EKGLCRRGRRVQIEDVRLSVEERKKLLYPPMLNRVGLAGNILVKQAIQIMVDTPNSPRQRFGITDSERETSGFELQLPPAEFLEHSRNSRGPAGLMSMHRAQNQNRGSGTP